MPQAFHSEKANHGIYWGSMGLYSAGKWIMNGIYPLVICYIAILKIAMEIVDFNKILMVDFQQLFD